MPNCQRSMSSTIELVRQALLTLCYIWLSFITSSSWLAYYARSLCSLAFGRELNITVIIINSADVRDRLDWNWWTAISWRWIITATFQRLWKTIFSIRWRWHICRFHTYLSKTLKITRSNTRRQTSFPVPPPGYSTEHTYALLILAYSVHYMKTLALMPSPTALDPLHLTPYAR